MNRKRTFILCGIGVLAACFIGTLSYLRYRNFHTGPFEENGTKHAVLFQDYGKSEQEHELEYVAATELVVDGVVKRPVFGDVSFYGRIEVGYFRDEKVIVPCEAKNAAFVSETDGMTEIWFRERLVRSRNAAVPEVDLKYYYTEDYEIIYLRWNREQEYTYWIVTGEGEEEKARRVLEEFWADSLYY